MIYAIPHFSVGSAYDYINNTIGPMDDPLLRTYCRDSLLAMYEWDGPASTKHHHVYSGGLVVHTAEVLAYLAQIDYGDDSIYAGILHDHKKVMDYAFNPTEQKWYKTPHGEQVYHIAEGYSALKCAMRDHPDQNKIARIGHMILSHHGRPEWGSPIRPQTQEADLLHVADTWSVRFGPARNKAARE